MAYKKKGRVGETWPISNESEARTSKAYDNGEYSKVNRSELENDLRLFTLWAAEASHVEARAVKIVKAQLAELRH